MSFSHTALRLAVVEALSPYAAHQSLASGGNPTWPTFAGAQVFDSQIAPVALANLNRKLPVITVATDTAKTEPRGTAQDVMTEGDGKQTAALAFEIMVPVKVRHDQGETVELVGPTDAFAKASLDMIASQILQRISDARMTGPLRHVLLTIERVESQPYSDPDTEVQLSALRLELTCQIAQQERWPPPSQTGLDRLPEPLRSVALGLPEGSYGRKIALGLADLIGDPAKFPLLSELRLAGNLARGPEDAPADDPDPTGSAPKGDLTGAVSFT